MTDTKVALRNKREPALFVKRRMRHFVFLVRRFFFLGVFQSVAISREIASAIATTRLCLKMFFMSIAGQGENNTLPR